MQNQNVDIQIEASARCNYACTFCPREEIIRDNYYLSIEFAKQIDKWLPLNKEICICGMGEPLLNKKLPEIANIFENRKVSIVTNASLLTNELFSLLNKRKAVFFLISIQSINKSNYNTLTKNGDIDNIIDLIKNIIPLLNNRDQLRISYIIDNNQINDEKEIEAFCTDLNIELFKRNKHNRGGRLYNCVSSFKENCQIAQDIFINTDGNILLCCHDLKAEHIIGNIFSNTYEEILHKKSRQKVFDYSICLECDDYYCI